MQDEYASEERLPDGLRQHRCPLTGRCRHEHLHASGVRAVLFKHVPSLSDEDAAQIVENIVMITGSHEDQTDIADLALRTCSCGVRLDGFYQYVDHLNAVFGGETHFGG